jgi:hypothetical protein
MVRIESILKLRAERMQWTRLPRSKDGKFRKDGKAAPNSILKRACPDILQTTLPMYVSVDKKTISNIEINDTT